MLDYLVLLTMRLEEAARATYSSNPVYFSVPLGDAPERTSKLYFATLTTWLEKTDFDVKVYYRFTDIDGDLNSKAFRDQCNQLIFKRFDSNHLTLPTMAHTHLTICIN